jgi:hypothetical protein
MNTETITKETDASGVFYRRTVHDDDGALVSDERVKRDPVLTFAQPPTLRLADAESVSLSIPFQLYDFDGEMRADGGVVSFRLQDCDISDDEGVVVVRQLSDGALTLALEFDTVGRYVLTVVPPLPADLQLSEPVKVKVE